MTTTTFQSLYDVPHMACRQSSTDCRIILQAAGSTQEQRSIVAMEYACSSTSRYYKAHTHTHITHLCVLALVLQSSKVLAQLKHERLLLLRSSQAHSTPRYRIITHS